MRKKKIEKNLLGKSQGPSLHPEFNLCDYDIPSALLGFSEVHSPSPTTFV
jgi:hypothetical protein